MVLLSVILAGHKTEQHQYEEKSQRNVLDAELRHRVECLAKNPESESESEGP